MAENASLTIPDHGWAVKGFKKVGSTTREDIAIPEIGVCMSIPGDDGKTDYGIPIEADLGIDFISNFIKNFKVIHNLNDFDFLDSEKELDDNIKNKIKEIGVATQRFCRDVIQLNYGMTLDKSMALKLLSQPGCEGIRLYLCSKKDNNVSLVAVGAHGCGKDLNYKATSATGEAIDDKPFVTNSLVGDYVTPPGTKVLNKLFLNANAELDEKEEACADCFVLLKMAQKRCGC